MQPPLASSPGGPDYGTVAAVRPIHPNSANARDPQAAITAAMGVAEGTAGRSSDEIIVRMDDGETLSVVQPDAAGPASVQRVGERVMVLPGGLPRVVAVPTTS